MSADRTSRGVGKGKVEREREGGSEEKKDLYRNDFTTASNRKHAVREISRAKFQ